MSTMIEKVARAIAKVDNDRSVSEGLDDFGVLQRHEDFARAAIEAMRDPTSTMLSETHEIVIAFGGDDGTYNIHCEDWQAKDVWMTMIDAALKEGK